jgi:hypothetical protein
VSMVEERVITKAVTMPIQASVLHGPRDIRLVRLSFCSVLSCFSVLFSFMRMGLLRLPIV